MIIGKIDAADAIPIKIALICCNLTKILPDYFKVQKIFEYFEYFQQRKRNATKISLLDLPTPAKKCQSDQHPKTYKRLH